MMDSSRHHFWEAAMAAAGAAQNAHPDTSDDEPSDALPLVEVLVRRHEETSSGFGSADGTPSPSAAFTAASSLNTHFFEHCGMAARSGLGALIVSLWHLWVPGDFTFLAAVVASVCLTPTVGSTLAKSMHTVYVVLLLPPLTLATLLLGSPAPLSAYGYTASVALAFFSFLIVLAAPPPTTRKLSVALAMVGVFRSCLMARASPLRPDAATGFAATDWAAVTLLIAKIMLATVAGVGAQVVAAIPFPRTAMDLMDIELRAAAAGVALHAEAVVAAMTGEVDPLSDEWGIETRRWREAVAEALAAAAEHSSFVKYESFLRYSWDAAKRRRQLGAMQGMARLLCKLGDAQLQLRAAVDRDGQLGGRRRDGRENDLRENGRQAGQQAGQQGGVEEAKEGSVRLRPLIHGAAWHGRNWPGSGESSADECADECTAIHVRNILF
jgi:hypothetical protein